MTNTNRKDILNKVYEYDRTVAREIEKLKKLQKAMLIPKTKTFK